MELSNRIESIRKREGFSQREIADKLGVSLSAFQYYERGERTPPADFIAKIVTTFGINGDWLLTGEGSMERVGKVAEEQGAFAGGYPYRSDVLRDVVETVESLFKEHKLSLPPDKKAELITLLYEELMDHEEKRDELPGKVLRFMKLAG